MSMAMETRGVNPIPTGDEFLMMKRIVENVAGTEFVPQAYRGRPEAILACILTGREMGIGPMQSLMQINMIQGTPSFGAELMLGLVYSKGIGYVEALEKNPDTVTVKGVRYDSGRSMIVKWTMEDAARAGLGGKSNWKTYPRQMLWARAISELVTQLFPDAMGGPRYTPDELGDTEYHPQAEAPVTSEGEVLTPSDSSYGSPNAEPGEDLPEALRGAEESSEAPRDVFPMPSEADSEEMEVLEEVDAMVEEGVLTEDADDIEFAPELPMAVSPLERLHAAIGAARLSGVKVTMATIMARARKKWPGVTSEMLTDEQVDQIIVSLLEAAKQKAVQA